MMQVMPEMARVYIHLIEILFRMYVKMTPKASPTSVN